MIGFAMSFCLCTLFHKDSRALPDMTSAPLKAPINWTASITLIGLILAAIIIPIYAYYYDFSVSAWVSLFFLLALSSMGITAGYHRLWAH